MSILNMQGKIATKALKEGESISLYLDRLKIVSRQLEAVGQKFSDIQYAYMLLQSLSSSYDPLIMTLQGRETSLTLSYVSQLVLQEEAQQKKEGMHEDHALMASSRS